VFQILKLLTVYQFWFSSLERNIEVRFIVEGVHRSTQADIQLVVDAASEEAAKVKAELQMPELIITRTRSAALGMPHEFQHAHACEPNLLSTVSLKGPLIVTTVFAGIKFIVYVIAMAIILDARGSYYRQDDITFAYVLFILAAIAYIIPFLIFMYRLWSIVPERYRRTTPGMAVGLMFIPLWNVYWVFQLIYGLAVDTRTWLSTTGYEARIPVGIALAASICSAISIIPFVSMVSVPALLVLQILFGWLMLRALQRIPADAADYQGPYQTQPPT